jgi:hypothetical protein
MTDPADPQSELLAQTVERWRVRFARRREAAERNSLPANCPFTKRLPKRRPHIADAIENGTISCCRIEWPSWLEGCKSEPPLCCIDGDEVYRFLHTHAFGQHAVIRIGKRRDEITVERSYYEGMFSEPERFRALLTEVDWERVQAAIAAADFWLLPRSVDPCGIYLDGFRLTVEGRRGDRFHASRFRQPDVREYRQLGRLAFDLGGLVDVDL